MLHLLRCSVLFGACFASSAGWAATDAELLREFAGLYSPHCTDPHGARISLSASHVVIGRDRKGVEIRQFAVQRANAGAAAPEAVAVLSGEAKPGMKFSLQLLQAPGQRAVMLDADAPLMGALGLAAGQSTRFGACRPAEPLAAAGETTASAATTTAGPTGVAASGGPDVLGIGLGMTGSQARAALLAAIGGGRVVESQGAFEFRGPDGAVQRLPRSDYLKSLQGEDKAPPASRRRLTLAFSPEPGQERLIRLSRSEGGIGAPGMGTLASVSAALAEKYGTPATPTPGQFVWVQEADGKPRAFNTRGCSDLLGLGINSTEVWSGTPHENTVDKLEALTQKCGSKVIQATLVLTPGVQPQPDTLVLGMVTIMSDLGSALAAQRRGLAVLLEATSRARDAVVKEQSKRKPQL